MEKQDLEPSPAPVVAQPVPISLHGGYKLYHRDLASLPSYETSSTKFVILGDDSQLLEVCLSPGQRIRTQPGTMIYTTDGESLSVETGECGDACARCCCAGESFFRAVFTNSTNSPQYVALAAPLPSKIVPVNMDNYPAGMCFKSGAYLASYDPNTLINYQRVQSVAACCFGGNGLLLNVLQCQGWAFFNAGGVIIERDLKEGESIYIDQHALMAWDARMKFTVKRAGGCCVICCSGDGINIKLTGPGKVYMDTIDWKSIMRRNGGDGNNHGNNNQ